MPTWIASSGTTTQSRRAALVATTALAPMSWGATHRVTTELLPDGRSLSAGCLRARPAGVALAVITRVHPTGQWWSNAAVLGSPQHRWVLCARCSSPRTGCLATSQQRSVLSSHCSSPDFPLACSVNRCAEQPPGRVSLRLTLLVLRFGARLDAVGLVAATSSMATAVVLTKKWGRPSDCSPSWAGN